MPQLLPGARQALDHVDSDIAAAIDELNTAYERAVANPALTRDCISKATSILRKMRDRVNELEPMLQRASPKLEQRVQRLEEIIERLEKSTLTILRKDAS